MFNVSKQTLWFIIILSSILLIYYIFTTDVKSSNCNDNHINHMYNDSTLKFDRLNDKHETSIIVRKIINRTHNQSKKIHMSPQKNNKLKKTIISMTNKLKKKLNKNNILKTKSDNAKITEHKRSYLASGPPNNKVTENSISKFKSHTKPKYKYNIRLYFAEWCPHCMDFKPIWNKLKEEYGDTINFIDMDCTNKTPELPFVRGYPTISISDKNNNYINNYEENYTYENFKLFLNQLN